MRIICAIAAALLPTHTVAQPFATCKEAHADGGITANGAQTLTMNVDSFFKLSNDSHPYYDASGQHIALAIKQTDFAAAARTQTQQFTVHCHFMDTNTPLAYIDVDNSTNFATWIVGPYEFKTSFSKLRFDEETQLIYTSDFTFATSTVKHVNTHSNCVEPNYNPCSEPMSPDWKAKLGLELPLHHYANCHNSKVFVPYGTMAKSDSTSQAGGHNATLSMDFGEDVEYAKLGANYLWEAAITVFGKKYYNDDSDVFSKQVGSSAIRTLVNADFVGVEVGNLQDYVDVKSATYDPAVASSYTTVVDTSSKMPSHLALGGWSLPLCIMYNISAACEPQKECTIPVNCINRRHIFAGTVPSFLDKSIVLKQTEGIVARQRRNETGAVHSAVAPPASMQPYTCAARQSKPKPNPSTSKSSSDTGLIIGISGGIVALAIAASCIACRNKKKASPPQNKAVAQYEKLIAM